MLNLSATTLYPPAENHCLQRWFRRLFRWGKGPTRAGPEAIEGDFVRQEELLKDGLPVIGPPGKRVWALRHYVFDRTVS